MKDNKAIIEKYKEIIEILCITITFFKTRLNARKLLSEDVVYLEKLTSDTEKIVAEIHALESQDIKSVSAEECTLEEEKMLILFDKYSNTFGKSPIKIPCMTRSAFVEALKDFAHSLPEKPSDEDLMIESEKVIINYLTHNDPTGDYKESTLGADDKRIWWCEGAKAARDNKIPISKK